MKSRRPWLLHGLHLVLACSVPVVLTLLLSCMKAKPVKEDLGPEVPPSAINDALSRMMQQSSLNKLAVGQYLDYTTTRRIENDDSTTTLGERRVEVIDRQNTSTDQSVYTLRITDTNRDQTGNFSSVVSEDSIQLDTSGSSSSTSAANILSNSEFMKTYVRALDSSAPTAQRISYYHLNESDGVIDAPPSVAARAGCSGLNPCNIPVHYVQFEMVLWQDAINYQKIDFSFAFSLATPYIPFGSAFSQLTGLLVVNCQSTYLPVEGTTVYVRDCSAIDDFQK